MATLHITRSAVSPALRRRPPPLLTSPPSRRLSLRCRLDENSGESKGEEAPESMFMKELKRRGMTPTSLLGESGKEAVEGEEWGTRNRVVSSTEFGEKISEQRERSMALNSEGLEGLIPRARLLLSLGGTFFLGFWPLILVTVGVFSALYIYFGPSFVHDASNRLPVSPPPYIDPYTLLEDERLSQLDSSLK